MGVVPPSQRPVLASSCILSRMRSAMVSRSSWLNTEAMYIMARPIGLEVSKLSRIETKSMPRRLSSSISPEKSLMLRLIRSADRPPPPELPLPGGLHHLFEAGPVEVAAREALILIDHGTVGIAVAKG